MSKPNEEQVLDEYYPPGYTAPLFELEQDQS